MAGKSCVAVVVDTRLGVGNAVIGDVGCRVLECGDSSMLALRGLQADVETLLEEVDARLRLRWIQDGGIGPGPRSFIQPDKLSAMVSIMLYNSRLSTQGHYFLEPIIAGVKRNGEAYLCAQDPLGAQLRSKSYVVAGTAAHSLHGACEALYEPDLEPDALLDISLRCMTAGLNRDCLSGRKVAVYLLTHSNGPTVIERNLESSLL
eukprot:CAMPEP_0197296362 /NCGR_PEP_ID=MMETSP0890-20130614/38198_1 /TAXON_ID=44058 ORGANISM="Aureoumbra lagunensis, Strain CCMP1510" /NCGR_SAMPLE_ID=MMETSP0890 /ASSEMBLY_ACC=CAM_ASM_000533 /LENGTH=204 /DNA_ID=CAMNT_0042772867 /DNA_START=198 /DNA_END=812 /DNA_ORIENTATION=-